MSREGRFRRQMGSWLKKLSQLPAGVDVDSGPRADDGRVRTCTDGVDGVLGDCYPLRKRAPARKASKRSLTRPDVRASCLRWSTSRAPSKAPVKLSQLDQSVPWRAASGGPVNLSQRFHFHRRQGPRRLGSLRPTALGRPPPMPSIGPYCRGRPRWARPDRSHWPSTGSSPTGGKLSSPPAGLCARWLTPAHASRRPAIPRWANEASSIA